MSRSKLSRRPFLALLALAALAPSPALRAQEEGEKKDEGKPAEGGKPDEKKAAEKDEWYAVVHGDVYTGTGAVLRDATVLAKNGVIAAIGHEVDVPPEAKTLDVTGLRVYPGLVSIASSGLMGGASGDFADTVDPFNSRMVLALASGITTCGQSGAALKLKRREIKGVVLRERYLTSLSYSASNPTAKRELEERFTKAAKYLRDYRDWEEKKKSDKDLKEPSSSGVDSTARSVLEGKTLAKFNANERGDLLEVALFAQRFGFRPVIDGCTEGWTVADELGRAGAFAIVSPRERRDKSEELVRAGGSSIENAAILHAHGVQVTIEPLSSGVDLGGIAGRDVLHLPIDAGFAIRGGLPDADAFEGITINPARLLGVEHRVGTLEVGKDADLIVLDGDVLHYQSLVQYTVVEGKLVYEKSKELYYAHIRPRAATALAPEKRDDKGEATEEAKPDAPKPEESGDEPDEQPEDKPRDGEGEKPGGG